jgi:hypothetical protein
MENLKSRLREMKSRVTRCSKHLAEVPEGEK